jgi:N-acetylglucosamine kinase-like BadF-type ATPase
VGVDGGTTKTIALVADGEGRILGAGRGGNSNRTGPALEQGMQIVIDTVERALTQAGREAAAVEVGVFGLAGADWPEDHVQRRHRLQQAGLARRVIVKNDAFVGLRAGTRKPYGVVIAAGTGCNAAAVAPDGREWHFGYYQDYGGGTTIGREAVRAVLRAEDGRGQATTLTASVLEALGYATPEALLRAQVAGDISKATVAGLCPLVFEAAQSGDSVGVHIIVKQGTALAEYATALIRRFEMQHLAFDLVLSGSVFKGQGSLLTDTIVQRVHCVAPHASIVRPRFEPAVGGLLLAYDALAIETTPEMLHNLAQTVPSAAFFRTKDQT